jgi:hypothetical protein
MKAFIPESVTIESSSLNLLNQHRENDNYAGIPSKLPGNRCVNPMNCRGTFASRLVSDKKVWHSSNR